MEIYLDTWNYTPHTTTDLEVSISEGRLRIYMSDNCDTCQGYFRSVEDIELVIKELQKYVDEVKK